MRAAKLGGDGRTVSAALARGLANLHSYAPFPAADQRPAWLALTQDQRAAGIATAKQALAQPWPDLPETLYRDFCATGARAPFEAAYFARRRQLDALVIGEAVQDEGRFLAAIEQGLTLICAESGWQLPAHNRHVRSGPVAPVPDPDRPVIDLFAADTGAQLAVISYLLADRLQPALTQSLRDEIQSRILTPYLQEGFWWMGRDGGRMNNWTTWCTQNVLIAGFLQAETDQQAAIARRAAVGLDAFLAEYGADGACPEGISYYHHAGLCLISALCLLDQVTGGAMAPVLASPKIKAIAEFPLLAHIKGRSYANFGDASPVSAACGARVYLAGLAVGSDDLCRFALRDVQLFPLAKRPAKNPAEDGLFDRISEVFATADMMQTPAQTPVQTLAQSPAQPLLPRQGFAKSIGMFMARGTEFTLAAKAGHNGDDHNHNDVGSFTLYKNGCPVLIDVGVETYSRKTFSPDRYEIWTMQSSFHNLPEFDGIMQQAGKAFGAADVRAEFDDSSARFTCEISGAYPPQARLTSYRRTLTLESDGTVTLLDHFQGQGAGVLNLMCCERPELLGDQIQLGAIATLTVQGAGQPGRAIKIEPIDITDDRLRAVWPDRIYRLRLPIAHKDLRITIT